MWVTLYLLTVDTDTMDWHKNTFVYPRDEGVWREISHELCWKALCWRRTSERRCISVIQDNYVPTASVNVLNYGNTETLVRQGSQNFALPVWIMNTFCLLAFCRIVYIPWLTFWHGYVLHQGAASQGRALCKSQMTSRVLCHTAAATRAHNVLQGTAAAMRAHNVLQGTVELLRWTVAAFLVYVLRCCT
jgi:hypothetical protein